MLFMHIYVIYLFMLFIYVIYTIMLFMHKYLCINNANLCINILRYSLFGIAGGREVDRNFF